MEDKKLTLKEELIQDWMLIKCMYNFEKFSVKGDEVVSVLDFNATQDKLVVGVKGRNSVTITENEVILRDNNHMVNTMMMHKIRETLVKVMAVAYISGQVKGMSEEAERIMYPLDKITAGLTGMMMAMNESDSINIEKPYPVTVANGKLSVSFGGKEIIRVGFMDAYADPKLKHQKVCQILTTVMALVLKQAQKSRREYEKAANGN